MQSRLFDFLDDKEHVEIIWSLQYTVYILQYISQLHIRVC